MSSVLEIYFALSMFLLCALQREREMIEVKIRKSNWNLNIWLFCKRLKLKRKKSIIYESEFSIIKFFFLPFPIKNILSLIIIFKRILCTIFDFQQCPSFLHIVFYKRIVYIKGSNNEKWFYREYKGTYSSSTISFFFLVRFVSCCWTIIVCSIIG